MRKIPGLFLLLLCCAAAKAQENSPYSRYGLGDLAPSQNIISRGMGGIAAGYSDFTSINFINPSSYGNLGYASPEAVRLNPSYQRSTIFDMGFEVDSRTLKTTNPVEKFTANNLVISYLQLGFPIKMKKANRRGVFLGANLGLKPISKINYKILRVERLPGIDSTATVYEGSGGLNEAYAGLGLRIKNFNIGANFGYAFGNKNYSTRLAFLNDSIAHYTSVSANNAHFGGLFMNGGAQYEFTIKKKALLRIGAYGSLQQNLTGSQDILRQTVVADGTGADVRVDSVYQNKLSGKVVRPATIGVGFTYRDSSGHWTLGADYETTQWDNYRYFEQRDLVASNWKIRAGVEYFPARYNTPIKKYFNFVRYRFGFNYGPDYIRVNSTLPEYGFTFGAGFPLKLRKGFYETQTSILNTAIEIGSRGNNQSNLKESTYRISFGLSLGDLWFRRPKYD